MIIGHTWQRNFLKEVWLNNFLPHAYLFGGPEGIGKKLIAQELAKLLLCVKPDKKNFKNCGQCINCSLKIVKHPDYLIVGDNNQEIRINEIRNIKKTLMLKPAIALMRVVLIDNAHQLNVSAANSLLKLLEEPASGTYFFLISHQPQNLLSTILSRTQIINFQPVPKAQMEEWIKKQKFKLPTELFIFLSQGRPALVHAWQRWLADSRNQVKLKNMINLIEGLEIFDWFDWGQMIEHKENEKINFELFHQIIVHTFLLKATDLLNISVSKYLLIQKKSINSRVINWFDKLLDMSYLLKTSNANTRLAWENVFWQQEINN